MSKAVQLDEQYWNNRYKTDQTGWDIGFVSTPLKEYFDQLQNKEIAILIPGCGNAYEAEYLLQSGFKNVTVVDLSSNAVEAIKRRLIAFDGKELHVIHDNFFNLQQPFDLIVEQTFFCAIEPNLRSAYANKINQLLKPNGKLVGLLFNRTFDGGPPFGGSSKEYEKLFSPLLNIKYLTDCKNSISPRAGTELFVLMQKGI
ncbi:MAG TPA: methyltransferase [Ferruginibacter sp.]|nr:methyltransferase [Ferruginibacter sp.]